MISFFGNPYFLSLVKKTRFLKEIQSQYFIEALLFISVIQKLNGSLFV